MERVPLGRLDVGPVTSVNGRVGDVDLSDVLADLSDVLANQPYVRAGAFSGTTGGVTSRLTVTHNLEMPTPHTVVIQPMTPNGGPTARWVGWNVTTAAANSFTIGRCVSQDGSLLAGTFVTGRFVLVAHA